MAAISSLGIGSELLTSELVDSIINADKAAGEFRLNTQQDIIDAKLSAYGDVQSKLFDFSKAVVALSETENAGATLATSSKESVLTATGTSSAPVGTYTVDVQRTAKVHSLVSKAYTTSGDLVGEGSLTFTLGTTTYSGVNYDTFTANPDATTKTIPTDATTTLSGLKDLINQGNFGVQANIINNGSGFVLQFTSEDTGLKKSMEIVAKDKNGALATSGIGAFAYNKNQAVAGTNLTETQKGVDALLIVNGLSVTRDSNEVTEVIEGVTLSLKGEDAGTNVSITVGADLNAITEDIGDLVDSYNAFQELYRDLTRFNTDDSTGSLLLGDSTLRTINNQIKNILTSTVTGVTGTNFRSFSELGISTDQNDSFKLKLDATLFAKGLKENREAVVAMFAQQGSTTDSSIKFFNESINTKAGNYDIVVTQLATQGVFEGGTVSALDFVAPVVINSANDNFTINLDGKTANITLTQASYTTGAALAAEIQLQINNDQGLKDRGFSTSVAFDSVGKSFDITSNAFGSSSQVTFSSVDNNTANSLGFAKLGEGEFKGVALTTLNNQYFNGFGSSSVAGSVSVASTSGIDFATTNATFSLKLNGGAAEAVTVNLNASGLDLNGDSTFGDRKDTLQAIQTAIDANVNLNGNVTASFDKNDKLVFTTTTPSATDSIEISAVGATSSDSLLGLKSTDGAQVNGKAPGLTFGANVDFKVLLNGTTSANTVNLPSGTYLTGAALATALQTAINTDLTGDANLTPLVSGAVTTEGTRDISTNIDFSTINAGFVLNVNGTEKTIIMDADSGNNITDIQAKLDTAYGAGIVTASLGTGNGLKLTTATVPPTHDHYIQVVNDGRGAFTNGGGVIAGGIDFSGANNATFDVVVDGITLNVDVNTDASSGDKTASLAAIQQALDLSILNNGQFDVGDIVAKLESGTDKIVFESVAKKGIKTSATFGSAASIKIESADANAQATLGLPGVNTTYNGGYDALGMNNTITYGSDITAAVSFNYDSVSDKGQLVFNIGGQSTTVAFDSVNAAGISFLGIHAPDGTETDIKTGLDTAGTINGVEAKGTGQFLTAQNGNTAASNGFYVSNQQSAIVSPPLTIDATNDTFTIELDGFESVITVAQGPYLTGAALATAVAKAINENVAIEAEGLKVKVDYTDDVASSVFGTIGIISTSTGTGSSVIMKNVSAAAGTAYGFIVGQADGEKGKAKDGDIDDASGIRLKLTGGALGKRGSVSYIAGIADQLKDLLQNFLDPSIGILATKFDMLDKQDETLAADRESFDARIAATEARLKSQFLYNDAIIASLKLTENFLTQQFEAMANASK